MKIKAIVITTIFILALTVVAAWQSMSRDVLAGVRDMAAAEFAAVTGVSVQFGEFEAQSLNTAIIHDVYVYDKEAKLIASSPKVSVSYSPLSLLLGKKSEMVTQVEVEQPEIMIVQKNTGRWNIEDIISEAQSTQPSFSGKIVLKNGQAEVNAVNGQWTLTAINGSLDFASRPSTAINLEAIYKDSPVNVSGTLNTSGDGVLSVKAHTLQLTDLKELLPADSSVAVTGGKAENFEATIKKNGGDISFAGQTEFDGVSCDVNNSIPVREASGLLTFTDERLYIFAKTLVWEQPVSLKGKVTINTGQPVLDLQVASAGFDPAAVNQSLPLSGQVNFDAKVAGPVDNLSISGSFGLAEGRFNEVDITNLTAKLNYADNLLTIESLNAGVAGGQVNAVGTVALATKEYDLKIKASQLDSALLGQFVPNTTGTVDLDIAAAGSGLAFSSAAVYGTAEINSGSYRDIAFANAGAGFYFANGILTLDYANVDFGDGTAAASGVVSDDKISLTVRGHEVPLSLLKTLDSDLPADGIVDFTGTISGTAAQPVAAIDFSASAGQVFYQPFTYAQGQLEITPSVIVINNVRLVDGPTTHSIRGSIALDANRSLNLQISTRQARAENVVKLIAPGEKLTGNVDNDIVISGPLDSFNIAGQLKLTEGSFRDQLIDSAQGSYRRENGITNISDFLIKFLNTDVKISGVILQDQELDLAITAQNLDVSRLRLNLPYKLTGRAAFSGRLTGTPTEPVFNGNVSADKLMIKDHEVTKVNGDVKINGNNIEIPTFKFSQGVGSYNFAGGYDMETDSVYGGIDVDKGDLAALFGILEIPAKDVSGQINGRITLSGTAAKPDVALTGGIINGRIKNYQFDTIDIEAALDNNVITVNKFFAKQGNGVLAIRGNADLNGPLNFEAGGRDIDAGLVSAIFNADVNVKGKLNFAAQVGGTSVNPRADVSLEIAGGGVGTSTFDSLYGLFVLQDHNININQFFVTKGPYRASAYGVIPVAALTSEGRQQATFADQMDVKVRLDQADLSILPLLTNEVSWAAGPTHGELTITGTVTQPYLSGNILIQGGTLKLAKLNDPIQKVDLDIQFKGDKIILKTFSGRMGSGSYQMTGSTSITGQGFSDYNFQLDLDKLGVNSKYFKGPLNGNLTLTTKRNRPHLAGKLLFEHDTIDIPFFTDFTKSDLNVGLDIELTAGDKVRFYNSFMYDIWAEGRIKFEGSTKRPNPSGQITAIRGTVSYLRTQFKIKDASAEFIQFGTFEPIIRLNAATKLQSTTINLSLSGPVSAMDMQLSSEPAMSQQEILSLLTLRSRYFDKQNSSAAGENGFGRDEIISFLDAGLQMRFVSEVENAFRDAFGLDDFRVVRDTLWGDSRQKSSSSKDESTNREVYNIEMGKYVTDRLMLNYTTGIDYDQHSFGFRYDLNRKISLTGSVDDQNDKRIGIETRFRF